MKKLDLDQQTIIWNRIQKEIFDQVEFDNERFQRLYLGLDKSLKTEYERQQEQYAKKPRPVELMSEEKMIGKYGTQQYQKYLYEIKENNNSTDQEEKGD